MPPTIQSCEVKSVNTTKKDVAANLISFNVVNKAGVKQGEDANISIQFSAANNGEAAENTGWKAYIDGTSVGNVGSVSLAVNETKSITTNLITSDKIVRIRIMVDYNNQIKETNENDNEVIFDMATG
jgi:subtilase family serine protease